MALSIIDRLRAGLHAATAPASAGDSVEKAVPAVVRRDQPIASGRPATDVAPTSTQPAFQAPLASVSRPDPGALPQPSSFVDLLRQQFSYGQNARIAVRQGAQNPFAVLRAMSEFGHIRTCIEARKDQMTSLTLEIRRKDKLNSKISDERVAAVKAFFSKPDKKRTWSTWVRLLIEEILVTDALSIYKRKTFGGDLYGLDIIDGTTILPMVDARGDIPDAPNVAYRQIVYGKPIEGGDCTVDDLMYRPRIARTHTVYGMSPIEWVLMAINAAINRDIYHLTWFTEGNVPESVVDAPASWNPDQIKEFEALINAKFSGVLNLGERHKMKVLSQGMAASLKQLKEPDFTGEYDIWLLKVICAAFGVPPSELGFTEDAGSQNTSKQQENVVYRRGVKPLALFIQDLLNEVIEHDLKEPGLEAVLSGGEPEDRKMQAEVDKIYIELGVTSPDEVAERLGLPGVGLGRFIMSGGKPVFVEQLLNPEKDDDATTSTPKNPNPPDEGGGEKATATSAGTAGSDTEADAVEEELKKYRANAIARAKKGKGPKVFQSTVLPDDVVKNIHASLSMGNDVASVVQTFDSVLSNVRKAKGLVRTKAQLEARIRSTFVDYFDRQGVALVEHLKPTAEALDGAAN